MTTHRWIKLDGKRRELCARCGLVKEVVGQGSGGQNGTYPIFRYMRGGETVNRAGHQPKCEGQWVPGDSVQHTYDLGGPTILFSPMATPPSEHFIAVKDGKEHKLEAIRVGNGWRVYRVYDKRQNWPVTVGTQFASLMDVFKYISDRGFDIQPDPSKQRRRSADD